MQNARPLFFASCLLAIAGCSSTPEEDPLKRPDRPEDHYDITRPGAFLLQGSDESLLVKGLNTWKREDGTLEAFEAELENAGSAALALEFRTIWKDGGGKEVAAEPWASLDVAPGARKVVGADATAPDARYVKIEVRPRP